jgi:hypothetical protein
MSKIEKVLNTILSGTSDSNINFGRLRSLLIHLDFHERIRGSHYIFSKDGIEEIINIQPKDKLAKNYQVKQVRKILLKYKLGKYKDE